MSNCVEHLLSNGVKILSSRQTSWKDILVEHYQTPPDLIDEESPVALSAHWLSFPSIQQPIHLTQQHGERWHESLA
jgi:hypothetical protein